MKISAGARVDAPHARVGERARGRVDADDEQGDGGEGRGGLVRVEQHERGEEDEAAAGPHHGAQGSDGDAEHAEADHVRDSHVAYNVAREVVAGENVKPREGIRAVAWARWPAG
jgi:hypothetical protein